MDIDHNPAKYIDALVEQRCTLSDDEVLAELSSLPVLPDEDATAWDDWQTWETIAYPYLALAHIVAQRKLKAGMILLLERASYGDPYEIMRGLRNDLEAVVNPNWNVLADACMQAAKLPLPGARLWAIDELGILRDARSFQTLIDALNDPASKVCSRACYALELTCQTNEAYRTPAIEALKRYLNQQRTKEELDSGREALARLVDMQ